MINIDLDSDRSRNPIVKNITLGELTDSIIAKDYSPNPFMPLPPRHFMPTFRPEAAEVWKLNRRLSQKDGMQQVSPAPQAPQQMQPPNTSQQHISVHNQNKNSISSNAGPGRSTPDDRHNSIIRIAQSSSPRTKQYDSITPPENYHYPPTHGRIPPPGHPFALDCYVKNKIVEVMRTEDDKRGDDMHEQQRRTPQQSQPTSSIHHGKEDRSTPGEYQYRCSIEM